MDLEQPRGFNLRRGRSSITNQVYIVTTVTIKREPLFADVRLGRILVKALRDQEEQGHVESLAFVVMPDHLHWMFSLAGRISLSTVVGQVKGRSAHEIGQVGAPLGAIAPKGASGGQLWQEGFHDHAIRREEDLKAVARYIVMNPVRAGVVKSVWEYPLWDAIWVE